MLRPTLVLDLRGGGVRGEEKEIVVGLTLPHTLVRWIVRNGL